MANDRFFSLARTSCGGYRRRAGNWRRDCCAAWSEAGARVAILDINRAAAEEVAVRLKGVGLLCDVSSGPSVQQAMEEVQRQLGPIQILVNNAGISGRTLPLWELDESDLDQVYAVNLKGVFLMCRAVISGMLAQRLRANSERRFHRRQGREPHADSLFQHQGRRHRLDQSAGQGSGGQGQYYRQRHFPRRGQNQDSGHDRQGNRPVHGEPHPHGPHRNH